MADSSEHSEHDAKKKAQHWPLIIGAGLVIGGIILARGNTASANPSAGETNALLAAQTQDNALGASLQESHDQMTAALAAENQQNNAGIVSGILGMLSNIFSNQQNNAASLTALHSEERYNLLQARSDNATARLINANNNRTQVKTTSIVANLEQELQAAQTQAYEYMIYAEELASGALGATPLPGTGGTNYWGAPTYPVRPPNTYIPPMQPMGVNVNG
jgi:hypothetical protein